MFKKRDLLIILLLAAAIIISILFLVFTRNYISIGDKKVYLDSDSKTIFISLPEGSSQLQPVSFSFFFHGNNVYIKKLSSGPEEISDPVEE